MGFDGSIDLFRIPIRGVYRANGRAAGRHFVNHGEIEVSIKRHGQRARNRCRRHDEGVRVLTFGDELQALHDSESMLLIDDYQTKPVEDRMLLDQRMCPNDNLNLATCNLF